MEAEAEKDEGSARYPPLARILGIAPTRALVLAVMTDDLEGRTLDSRRGFYRRGLTIAVISSILVHLGAIAFLWAPSWAVMRAFFGVGPAPVPEAAAETADVTEETARKSPLRTSPRRAAADHPRPATTGTKADPPKVAEPATDDPAPASAGAKAEADRPKVEPRSALVAEPKKKKARRKRRRLHRRRTRAPEQPLEQVLSSSARGILGEETEEEARPSPIAEATATIERLYAARLGLFLRHRCAIPADIPQAGRSGLRARVLLRIDEQGGILHREILKAPNEALARALEEVIDSLNVPEPPERIVRQVEGEGLEVEVTWPP